MNRTALSLSLALAASAAFTSVASAQWMPRPTRPTVVVAERRFAYRPMPIETRGTVARVLSRSRLVLTNGTRVQLRAPLGFYAARQLTGMPVLVRGLAMPNQPHFITNARLASLRPAVAPATSVSGTIRNVHLRSGRIAGLRLSNGQMIVIPARLGRALARRGVQTGQFVHATGHHAAAPNLFVARSLTFSHGYAAVVPFPGSPVQAVSFAF